MDRYGAQTAYLLLAGGFTLFGMVAALVVTVKEQEEEVTEAQAEAEDTPAVAKEVAMQAPLALLSALLASPMGPSSAFGIAKLLGRNLPLVLLLVIGGFLLWPRDPAADGADLAEGGPHRRAGPEAEWRLHGAQRGARVKGAALVRLTRRAPAKARISEPQLRPRPAGSTW